MKRYAWLVLMVVASSTLSACGFHLRGSRGAELDFHSAYVKGSDDDLVQRLRDTLRQSSVEVMDVAEGADVVLDIEATRVQRRILTIDRAGNISEYELRYEVDLTVRDGAGAVRQPKRTIEQVTEYTYDPKTVLAKDEEEQVLVEDLREGAIRDVMRQLTRLPHAPAAPSP